MSSTEEQLKRGKDLALKALEADNAAKYAEAIKYYTEAIEVFIHVKKWCKNPSMENTIQEKVVGYLNRAEQLKAFVKDEEEKAANPKGGKKAAAEGEGDGDDQELRAALAAVVEVKKPNVSFADVAGLENAKSALQEAVILPIRLPFLFGSGRESWKGILLFGPPGTGKSHIAQAIAHEAENSTFMAVSSADLVSKWQGQSERLVRMLFKMAREKAPTILFIDEIDSLCGARGQGNESESSRRIKTEFLVQMSGVAPKPGERFLVLGATNTPWSLDDAFRRRFEKRILIPLPDPAARLTMFKIHIGKETRHTLTDADLRKLAAESERYSGADIKTVCKDALMAPIRRMTSATHFCRCTDIDRDDPEKKATREYWTPCSPGTPGAVAKKWTDFENPEAELIENPVTLRDMQMALKKNKATASEESLRELEKWNQEFGSDSQ
jgi:vacuolar protein-sorting-associated protein 4